MALTSAGAAQAGRPCQLIHLHGIIYNLKKILEAYVLGEVNSMEYSPRPGRPFRGPRETEYDKIVSDTTTEIDRLIKNPALFPDDNIREEFFSELRGITARLQKAVEIFENFHEDEDDFLELRAQTYENDRLPLKDGQLKPWQQFLSKNAPGVHLSPQLVVSVGATQVVPMPGVRILLDMINGAMDIYKDIEKVSLETKLRFLRASDTYDVQEHGHEGESEVGILDPRHQLLLLKNPRRVSTNSSPV